MNRKKEVLLIAVALVIFIPLVLLATFLSPEEVKAISIFSPFGGKIISWVPEAPGCAPHTIAVSAATLGTVNITVEELVVGPPKGGTFGILRVDGATVPFLTTIYEKYTYFTPGVWALGNSIDICDVCGKVEDLGIPFVDELCGTAGIKEILDVGCDIVGSVCPITNLIHKVGSGLPTLPF